MNRRFPRVSRLGATVPRARAEEDIDSELVDLIFPSSFAQKYPHMEGTRF
jgi:hypothetical protein